MARIVIIGAGLGGAIMAFEMKDHLKGKEHTLTVINKGTHYSFVPSNPWVAVGWRKKEELEVELAPVMAKRGIAFHAEGAKRISPETHEVEMLNGTIVPYDYLIIATGPELAFDEIEGLGPDGFTQSICHVDHAVEAFEAYKKLEKKGGPVIIGAASGASCFGPAYEFAFTVETALRKAKKRDAVPMTFVTPEPYIGHLGLDGVGDTKGLMESAMREKHIKWITNAKITKVEDGKMYVDEVNDDGSLKTKHELPFAYSMILPAFRGVEAHRNIEGLSNPRGFILTDKHQRNPKYPNIFAVGVCVALPPVSKTPLPVGTPKTGFMIESMVTAVAENISALLAGKEPTAVPSLNAMCLADFGDTGIAFIAQPQIPPRNVNWSSSGMWVHAAKAGFETYFLSKVRHGQAETFYEKMGLKLLGLGKLKEVRQED
ncbi:MAG: FAD/NAD(P)-binding oxidoreductase [Alphaproteobacteria bacterium]